MRRDATARCIIRFQAEGKPNNSNTQKTLEIVNEEEEKTCALP